MASFNFDATTVQPARSFEPLPNGTYRCHITESEMKPTKNGQGQYMQLVWEVLDGEHKGRKIFDRLNVNNPNATAQDIARRALSAICHATGVLKLANSQQLHNKPVLVKLVVKDGGKNPQTGEQYGPRNEVKGYEAVDGAGVPLPKSGTTAHGGEQAAAVAATASTNAPAAASPPWARKSAA